MTKYLVWRPEYGQEPEDGAVVDAYDANAAACKWAERSDVDGADYLIVQGRDATVRVQAVNKPADAWEMIVSGESVPSYRARVRIALCEKCGMPPGCPDCRAVHDVPIGA